MIETIIWDCSLAFNLLAIGAASYWAYKQGWASGWNTAATIANTRIDEAYRRGQAVSKIQQAGQCHNN